MIAWSPSKFRNLRPKYVTPEWTNFLKEFVSEKLGLEA
jgi:hypothetical protein